MKSLAPYLLLVLLFPLLCCLAYWRASEALSTDLHKVLHQELLPRSYQSELYSQNEKASKQFLAEKINQDFAELCAQSVWQFLTKCSVKVMSINGKAFEKNSPRREFYLYGDGKHAQTEIVIGLFYQVQWWYLLASQFLVLLSAALLIYVFPKPVTLQRKHWIDYFKDQGESVSRAHTLSRKIDSLSPLQQANLHDISQKQCLTLPDLVKLISDEELLSMSPEQYPWFLLALYKKHSLKEAKAIALSAPRLVFEPREKSVLIHGLRIAMPSTPFFYYYWYALRRFNEVEDGWFINPPVNRADSQCSAELAQLISYFGGHSKAVNDLQSKGLRAKTLDQNRSKIKDELVRELGEEVAQMYLFDAERDPKTARYKYRLSLHPKYLEFAEKVSINVPYILSEADHHSSQSAVC